VSCGVPTVALCDLFNELNIADVRAGKLVCNEVMMYKFLSRIYSQLHTAHAEALLKAKKLARIEPVCECKCE
jgi:hypothetical protein